MHNKQPDLVFSINSGRSGSRYLARLLATAKDVYAFHEAEPDMSGSVLRMVMDMGLDSTFDARNIKAQAIRKIISALPAGATYAETNHMFIKTFFDIVMESMDNLTIKIIILRRYLPAVLKSFINMGYFSERNPVWPSWMHLPGTCESAFIPPSMDRNPDQYDLAIGYLLDIEMRILRFKERYPECETHEIRLELLQSPAEVETFLKNINLLPTAETRNVIGISINKRNQRKVKIGLETTLEYCEQRIREYLDICRASDVEIPPLPQTEQR